jgi:DNA-directed RNA polymerase specialized sigma24 family protein
MNETKAIDLCIQHRNTVGFEFLVENYRSQAYAHAFGFMGNWEDAADACQDAFRNYFVSINLL